MSLSCFVFQFEYNQILCGATIQNIDFDLTAIFDKKIPVCSADLNLIEQHWEYYMTEDLKHFNILNLIWDWNLSKYIGSYLFR